ncbi:MAG: integrin alpha [Actinomycetota bacterium]
MRRVAVITLSVLLFAVVGQGADSFGATGATGAAAAAAARARADFNGDGFSDMAVGVSAETLGGQDRAGAVNVIYGSATGLAPAGNQFWTQASPGVPTDPQAGGRFGAALAAGDFNGDGFTDLAIGVPGQTVDAVTEAGVVIVLYGTPAGLTSSGSQLFDQNSELMQENAESSDHFGATLAAGNFGRTGEDDLAIGVSDESVGAVTDAGAVQVVYGSITGLSQNGNQLWTEDSPGMAGDGAETDDNFSGKFGQVTSLVAADFGKDGRADLAVSVVGEDVGSVVDAGAAIVLYGGAGGLTAAGSQFFSQDTPGVPDQAEDGDSFGASLAAADFGKNAKADLAIGVPSEGLGTNTACGAVDVLYGTTGGLTTTGSQLFTQDTPGVKDQCEAQVALTLGDDFGFSLASANFGKSAQADLVVGVPGEDIGTVRDAGAVNVLYGTATGLSTTGNQFWSQDSPGVADSSEGKAVSDNAPDLFGFAMLATNFGKTAQADLAIGVIGENLVGNTLFDPGAVNVLYGGTNGLSATGNKLWTQDSPGIKDQSEAGDEFGFGFGSGSGSSSR